MDFKSSPFSKRGLIYLFMYFWVRPGMCRVLKDQALCDLIFGSIHRPADLKAEECLNKCLNEVLKYVNEVLSLASDSLMIF